MKSPRGRLGVAVTLFLFVGFLVWAGYYFAKDHFWYGIAAIVFDLYVLWEGLSLARRFAKGTKPKSVA
ncbi:MAG: hypothetical protein FJ039_00690 [Chloroflexi bacterium]|nr:hypothetical protein [Chloroflexota bacterium]